MSIAGKVPDIRQQGVAEGLTALDGERGMPSVNAIKRSNRGRYVFIAIFGLLVAGAGGLAFFTLGSDQVEEKQTKAAESSVPQRTFEAPPLPAAAEPAVVPAIVPPVGEPALPGTMATTRSEPGGDVAAGPPPPTLDKSASGMMVDGSQGGASADPGVAAGTGPATAGLTSGNGRAGGGALDGLLSGTDTPMQKASMLGDRNFILAKGSFINCALQTRLDSTVPGMAACRVTRNVYSDNGKVLLIERGSTVTGEYQANMKQGMSRIYVLWTRVKTPFGVVVNLDSPGADNLGGGGVPGYVNNHFWKRFGGALLLSIIDDAAKYGSQQQGDQTIRMEGTSEAATNMAGIALENTINIPPTLYRNQGEEVGIFIARDLDFSEVYRVEPK